MHKKGETRRARFGRWLRKILVLLLNPRFLLCFGLAWLITNGWSYILLGLSVYYEIEWMSAVAGAYLAFLWLPATPEKIVTLVLSVLLLRHLFPHDEKTLGVLRKWRSKETARWQNRKRKKKVDPSREDSEKHDRS